MQKSDITRAFAEKALLQHGRISLAAKELASDFDRSPRTVEGWLLSALRDEESPGILEDADATADHENAIRAMLSKHNIPAEAIARLNIKGLRLNSWGTAAKVVGADGVERLQKEGLWSTSLNLTPVQTVPDWPVVQQPPPLMIKYMTPLTRDVSSYIERTFLIPDIQIGYWKTPQGLVAMHDLNAIECMLAILHDFKADRVIILGDFLDCSELSRYLQVAEFQETFQPALNYAYELLSKIRAIVGPKTEIVWVPGNHERRVAEYIVRNARAAYGITRAGDTSNWPVMSVPHLLRLEELGVQYLQEYPGGQYFITPELVCQHAPPTTNTDLRASIIHGHVPKYNVSSRTVHYADGPKTYYTFCIPGLMRIDDTLDRSRLVRTQVPSDRTRVSWCQGVGAVFVDRSDRSNFTVQVYPITNGKTIFEGKSYSRVDAFSMEQEDFDKKWARLGRREK